MVVTMFEVWAISAVVSLAYVIWERKQRADLKRRVGQLEAVTTELLRGKSDAILASTQKMADSVTKMMEDIQKDMGDDFGGPSMN